MKKRFSAFSALCLLGLGIVSAASQSGTVNPESRTPMLEFYHEACQKCHGFEGELMSPGWAEGRTLGDLGAILDQMVTEQAGHAPLSADSREALISFHLASSRSDPWAHLISVKGGEVVLESTRGSRLSAEVKGRKVAVKQASLVKKETGETLLRHSLILMKGEKPSDLSLTLAKGEGKAKKVVRWQLSERAFSHPLPKG